MNYTSNLSKRLLLHTLIITFLTFIIVFIYPSLITNTILLFSVPSIFISSFGVLQVLSIYTLKPLTSTDIPEGELELRQAIVGFSALLLIVLFIIGVILFFIVDNYLPSLIIISSLMVSTFGYIVKESFLLGKLSDDN